MYGKMQREGILFWTITRRQVSRDIWLLRPSPVIAYWVSYNKNLLQNWEWAFSAMRDKMVMKCPPPQVWSDLWPQGGRVNYKLALTKSIANDWITKAFAICLYGNWAPCCYSCWLSQPLREFRVGWGTLCSRESGGSLDSWMFLGTDYIISILASPHMWRSTKSLHGAIRPSWLTKNLL